MGDSGRWPEARGLSAEGSHSFRAAWAAFQAKGDEWWATAERRAADLITSIQPNPESEKRRQDVVDYVTKLIQSCVDCKVVKFGSVPLKTYLPDGDIDLTVVSPNPEVKRTWFDDVYKVLQKEITNPNAEFRVTEVHGVPEPEVKLIKICVAKLLVDVSFDQLGGVCTLCFLEEVDRFIGDDHLFKRSIILVKAWCFYESRLLGAANNLMSTYALETLVLYIFHIFHASLRGPLQVLYLFLEFFSGFDWDKYCVSLSSPILLASFSEETERQSNIAEDFQKLALTPGREGGELLFSKAFLDACERAYGGLIPVHQLAKPHKFAVKSLNIIDPLRSTNNLGRSVNQGNCARIRRAFVLGARTMRSILTASEANVGTELDQFFKNCNSRKNQRLDVAGPSPRCFTMANGNHGAQARTNGWTSSSSRTDSEKEEECSSHSSSKENFETTRNGSSSLLQDRAADQHPTPDFSVQAQVSTASNGKPKVSVGNEEEREFSAPVDVYKQSGNGSEYSEVGDSILSKGRGRKGRAHQQNGFQIKDPEGSGIVNGKPKRGKSKGTWAVDDGKEKVHGRAGLVAQDGCMRPVSSSSAGSASYPYLSPVPASGYQHVHSPRHSSSDGSGGAHFKNSQSRPYPNATGPGSFRHPLANYQFDPGTARMAGGGPGPNPSSFPQYLPYYPGYAPPGMFPPGFSHVMYSPSTNIHKRNSPGKGDGNGGMNANNRTANGTIDAPVENSGGSPRNRSRWTASEQITVGIVERLEAEGVISSKSSKRSQEVGARNTRGADSGGSSSEFLAGDLKLHLDSLAYGPFCEYSCSPYLHQILYPAYALEQHAQKHGCWEGPGRPGAALQSQLLGPQFYASGPGWFQPFHQAGFFPFIPHPWGTRGVELSPRPRGTGTYLPNTQLRQNIKGPGKSQNRGVVQNGCSQQDAQRSSNRVVGNRTVKSEGVDFARVTVSDDSHPSEPLVSGPCVSTGEVPQPIELVVPVQSDLSSVPLDVREPCGDTSGLRVMVSGSSESDGSSELSDFLSCEDLLLDQGGKSGAPLEGSVITEHSSDDPTVLHTSPTTVGEVIPTATTQRPSYHMNEEDFPPLVAGRVSRAESMPGGAGSIANVIASYVSF